MPPHPTEPCVQFGAPKVFLLFGMPICEELFDNLIIGRRLAIEKKIIPDRVERRYGFYVMKIEVSQICNQLINNLRT